MSDGPPPGDQQDTRQGTARPATVPVADAARRLGISPDAVRGRLQRGTLAGEKIAGVWHVVAARLNAGGDGALAEAIAQAMNGRRLGDNARVPLTTDERARVDAVLQDWLGAQDPD